MNDFWHLLWDIFVVIGLACIAATVSTLSLLYFASRCEAKRWRAVQNRESKQDVANKYGIRPAYLDRSDDSYTEAAKRTEPTDGVWMGQPRYIRNRLKIDHGQGGL